MEELHGPLPGQQKENDQPAISSPVAENKTQPEDQLHIPPTTTDTMEVHHHAHSPRKKWSHYFWEFFMLFLAVSAGFFVENQREHYVEHKRARELAVSIYNDIRNDTAALRQIIDFSSNKLNNLDSLGRELKLIPAIKNDTSIIYHAYWLVRFQPFARNKATYDQVKSSGMLRYFKLPLVNLLTAYDVMADEALQREQGEYAILINRMVPYLETMLNFEAIYDISFDKPLPDDLYVDIADRASANRLINSAAGIKINRTRLRMQYEKMKHQAEEILVVLKDEYDLD